MTPPPSPMQNQNPEHVIVWAPVGRTGQVIRQALEGAGLSCVLCDGMDAFCQLVGEGAGAALLIEEVFASDAVTDRLLACVSEQPAWSDLPVKVFVTDCRRIPSCLQRLQRLNARRGVTVLERPISPPTLVSILEAALRDRRRQYRLRDALRELQEANETLEARVEARAGEVRALASALTVAEQRERRRISQVLHDGLQQLLYAAKMQAGLAELRGSAAAADFRTLTDTLDQAIHAARSLTVELSPPALQTDGLVVALEGLAEQVEERFGLRVAVEAERPCEPSDDDHRELLFQSVRELLFNVVKHAGVDEAQVRLYGESDRCTAEVIDEGVGFDPATLGGVQEDVGGFGLASVLERVRLVGGSVEMDAAPGRGARFTLSLPMAGA